MMLVTESLAARAIVGADIRIDCVLNESLSNPKKSADDLTATYISVCNKHVNRSCTRNDKNGSASNRKECFDTDTPTEQTGLVDGFCHELKTIWEHQNHYECFWHVAC